MDFNLFLRNRGVARVLVGVPTGGTAVAARIVTSAGDVIALEESTLAALARAYLCVTTHPTVRAVELAAAVVSQRKDGFGEVQLLDTLTPEADIRSEFAGHGLRLDPDDDGPMDDASSQPTARPVPPAALATEHGHADPDALDDDLDLDDLADEEPLFGIVKTEHSRPRSDLED